MDDVVEVIDQIMALVPKDYESYKCLDLHLRYIQIAVVEYSLSDKEAAWKQLMLRLEEFLPVPVDDEWTGQIRDIMIRERFELET